MTEVQTKSYFFIYTIKLWNAWPQDAVVAKSVWRLKSKSEESAGEKCADGYQTEGHCCWFIEQMGCKSLGEGPERLLWGSIIILLHCSYLPAWTFAVALCHCEDTGVDGPLVWLCTVILTFLTCLCTSSPWRWQKTILSKILYPFVWLNHHLSKWRGKKCSWKSKQEALCKQRGTGWCLQSYYSSCSTGPERDLCYLQPEHGCRKTMKWSHSFFFFFPRLWQIWCLSFDS